MQARPPTGTVGDIVDGPFVCDEHARAAFASVAFEFEDGYFPVGDVGHGCDYKEKSSAPCGGFFLVCSFFFSSLDTVIHQWADLRMCQDWLKA